MAVTIREPEIPDAAGMGVAHSRLWLANYGEHISPQARAKFDEAALAGQWHDLLVAPTVGRRIAVAVERGRIVGISMTVPTVRQGGTVPPARERELSMLYLFPEYQGQGYGKRLLEYVVGPTDPAQLWLPSGYSGEGRAHRFFRRAGFLTDGVISGVEPNYGMSLNRLVR